jgi:hypothetical protein
MFLLDVLAWIEDGPHLVKLDIRVDGAFWIWTRVQFHVINIKNIKSGQRPSVKKNSIVLICESEQDGV